jgi:hypothetical protein
MAFDDSSERKELVWKLKSIVEDTRWESISATQRNKIMAIYIKHVEIVLNALRDIRERKLSAVDAQDSLYLTQLKALEVIQPMIEKFIEDAHDCKVKKLMKDFSGRIMRHIVRIGEGWGRTGNGK